MSAQSWSIAIEEPDHRVRSETERRTSRRWIDTSELGHSSGSRIVTGVGDCMVLRLPRFADARGSLVPIEMEQGIPLVARRFFCIFDVPDGHIRGEHAHRECAQFLVAIKGGVSVVVDDGEHSVELRLDRPDVGLLVPSGVWAEQSRFTADAVLAVFASDPYDADDYIRSYGEFTQYISELPSHP